MVDRVFTIHVHICIRVETAWTGLRRAELRFPEEIFPGSHFPGGLARPDNSLVFRRVLSRRNPPSKGASAQLCKPNSSSTVHAPECSCAHVYVCKRFETFCHFFRPKRSKITCVRVWKHLMWRLLWRLEAKFRMAKKSKSAII